MGECLTTDYQVVEEDENLEDIYRLLRKKNTPMLPVLRDGQLVGLLTLDNIGEMVMIRSALASHSDSAGSVITSGD